MKESLLNASYSHLWPGSYSGYFVWSQIGLLHLLDTRMTPPKQYGDMSSSSSGVLQIYSYPGRLLCGILSTHETPER